MNKQIPIPRTLSVIIFPVIALATWNWFSSRFLIISPFSIGYYCFIFLIPTIASFVANLIVPLMDTSRRAFYFAAPSFLSILLFAASIHYNEFRLHGTDELGLYVVFLYAPMTLTGLITWAGVAFWGKAGALMNIRVKVLLASSSQPNTNLSILMKGAYSPAARAAVGITFVAALALFVSKQTYVNLLEQAGWTLFELRDPTAFVESIEAIRIDKMGHPWALADTGLYHFNGTKWEKYFPSYAPGIVTKIDVDKDARIWAATNSGVYIMDENGISEQVESQKNNFLMDIQGQAWTWCGSELLCRVGGNESIIENEAYDLLTIDRNGNLWAIYMDAIMLRKENNWIEFPMSDHGYFGASGPYSFDTYGNPWIALSPCCLLASFNDNIWNYEKFKIYKQGWILAMDFDKHGNLWVLGTFGLAIKSSEEWFVVALPTVLNEKNNYNRALFIDENNRVWIGAGSSIIYYDSFGEFPSGDPIPASVMGMIAWSRMIMYFSAILAVIMGVNSFWITLKKMATAIAETDRIQN